MAWTHGSLEYMAGFEAGDRIAYLPTLVGTDRSSIVTTPVLSGNRCLRWNKTAAVDQADMIYQTFTSRQALAMAFRFRLATGPTPGNWMAFFSHWAFVGGSGLGVENVGGNQKLIIFDDTVGGTWRSSTTLALNTTYIICPIFWNPSTGANQYWNCQIELRDNSGALLESSMILRTDLSLASPSINTIAFGTAAGNIQLCDYYIDDVMVVSGGVKAPPNPQIVPVVPTGNSATDNAWTAGTGGNKWDEVDEIPADDDTTYIKSTATSQAQSFTHAAVSDPGSSGNVLAVAVYGRFRNTSGTLVVAPRIRDGANTCQGVSIIPTTSYSYTKGLWVRRPSSGCGQVGGDAGNGWMSGAVLDGLEFGVIRTIGTSVDVRCTQSIMEVAWGAVRTDDWARQRNFIYTP